MNEKTKKQLKEIMAECIRVNPSIVVNAHAQLIKFDRTVEYFEEKRPIRLADILKTMQNKTTSPIGVDINGYFMDCDNDMRRFWSRDESWNLAEDDVREQTPETIAFIHSAICV